MDVSLDSSHSGAYMVVAKVNLLAIFWCLHMVPRFATQVHCFCCGRMSKGLQWSFAYAIKILLQCCICVPLMLDQLGINVWSLTFFCWRLWRIYILLLQTDVDLLDTAFLFATRAYSKYWSFCCMSQFFLDLQSNVAKRCHILKNAAYTHKMLHLVYFFAAVIWDHPCMWKSNRP
jgi:hypothetical protein